MVKELKEIVSKIDKEDWEATLHHFEIHIRSVGEMYYVYYENHETCSKDYSELINYLNDKS